MRVRLRDDVVTPLPPISFFIIFIPSLPSSSSSSSSLRSPPPLSPSPPSLFYLHPHPPPFLLLRFNLLLPNLFLHNFCGFLSFTLLDTFSFQYFHSFLLKIFPNPSERSSSLRCLSRSCLILFHKSPPPPSFTPSACFLIRPSQNVLSV